VLAGKADKMTDSFNRIMQGGQEALS